jgi:hypothetical protein
MQKGGRPTPQDAGKTLAHRDLLWDRIQTYPEGALFKAEEITGDDRALMADFAAMRDHDYVHVTDGWLTGIRETTYVRMLPHPQKVAQSWLAIKAPDDHLVEFGDWCAWRMNLYPWEPIAGYRFRCATPKIDTILALGHMRMRIESGPAWLRDETPAGELLRALHDTAYKNLKPELHRWLLNEKERKIDLLQEAKALAEAADVAWHLQDLAQHGPRPSLCVDIVDEVLRSIKEKA